MRFNTEQNYSEGSPLSRVWDLAVIRRCYDDHYSRLWMIPPHLSRARAASEWSGQRLTSTSSSPSQPVTAGDRRWRLTGGTPLWRDQLLFPAAWWTSPWDVEDNRPWELHPAGMRRCGVLRQSCCSVRPFACLPVCLSSCLCGEYTFYFFKALKKGKTCTQKIHKKVTRSKTYQTKLAMCHNNSGGGGST